MAVLLHATARLTASLQAVAAALVSPDEAALLTTETALAQAIDDVRAAAALGCDDRAALLDQIRGVRVALARCRTLGTTATDLVQRLLALDDEGKYDNLGGAVSTSAPRGAQLQATL